MASRILRHRILFWLAIMIFFLALGLLVAAALPLARVQQVMPLPAVILPSPTPSPAIENLISGWGGA